MSNIFSTIGGPGVLCRANTGGFSGVKTGKKHHGPVGAQQDFAFPLFGASASFDWDGLSLTPFSLVPGLNIEPHRSASDTPRLNDLWRYPCITN